MFKYSISKFYNYVQKDYIIDWLNLYGVSSGFKKEKKNTYFMDIGNDLEKQVLQIVSKDKKVTDLTQFLFKNYTHKTRTVKSLTDNSFDFIYQGLVAEDCFYGIPDFIVKKKVVSEWMNKYNESMEYLFEDDDGLVIVDVKTSCKINNGVVSKSTRNYNWLQFQMSMYCKMLSSMTSKPCKNAYIMSMKNNKIMIGSIDLCPIDTEALKKYMNDMSIDGAEWKLFPKPSCDYLYPNMKNEYDQEWRTTKEYIAKRIGEWTLMPFITFNDREKLWNKGFKTFREDNILKEIDNLPVKVHKNMIKVNQGDVICNTLNEDKVVEYIKANISNDDCLLFIDIETLFTSNENKMIFVPFMACVYCNKDFKKEIILAESSPVTNDETNEVISKVSEIIQKYKRRYENVKVIHYSGNEAKVFEKIEGVSYIDLYSAIKTSDFAITGLFSYRLKDLYKFLVRNNEESNITNGFDAMWHSVFYYDEKDTIKKQKYKNDLDQYISRDVEILVKIYRYFERQF